MEYERLEFPMEYRADTSNESPGLLSGVVMVYGTKARDRAETFGQDAFHWNQQDGILIRELHPQRGGPEVPPIMRAMPYLEGRELRINAPLPNTARGRDVAESMKGPLPLYGGLSVEFAPERETRQGGLRLITRAYLGGAALVLRGAYPESTVEVRSEAGLILPSAVTMWL